MIICIDEQRAEKKSATGKGRNGRGKTETDVSISCPNLKSTCQPPEYVNIQHKCIQGAELCTTHTQITE